MQRRVFADPTVQTRRPYGRNNGNNPYPNLNRQQLPQRSRTLDSNGPNVKIRGAPHQIFERYIALAREASTSGDRIAVSSAKCSKSDRASGPTGETIRTPLSLSSSLLIIFVTPERYSYQTVRPAPATDLVGGKHRAPRGSLAIDQYLTGSQFGSVCLPAT